MDLDDSLEDKSVKLRKFPGSHLSAPLTYYPQRLIIQYYSSGDEAPIVRLRQGVMGLEFVNKRLRGCNYTEDPSQVYYLLFKYCVARQSPSTMNLENNVQELGKMLLSCCEELSLNLSSIKKQHKALSKMDFKMSPKRVNEVVYAALNAYKCFKFTSEVRGSIQLQEMQGNKGDVFGPFKLSVLTVYHQSDMIVCKFSDKKKLAAVLNYDQWIMLCDTVISRFITIVTCELNYGLSYDVLPSPNFLRELYSWGDSMIRDAGVTAYAVIGEFESIITSCFVSFAKSDPLGLGNDFILSVSRTALEIEEEYKVPSRWTHQLRDMMKKQASVNVLSEVFGLRKHWGNPMVEAAASGRAVQEKLDENLPISGTALVELTAALNRMITIAFIKKHHRWPKCNFINRDNGDSYPLKRAQENNSTILPELHPDHKHLDWSLLVFECNCVLDSYENQLEILSDKSVSLPVDELDHVYFKGMKDEPEREESTSERRLILKFLQEEQLSVNEILKRVMDDDIPQNWLANSAAMKGTEVKFLKARIFAVLTYEMRQYFAVTEDMIKKHVFPYNPHQTMTMNETELLAKLRGMTKQMDMDSTSRTLNVMHIIDFSKWNLRMRYENTCGIFTAVDNFLGTPGLIEKSHILFNRMVNLVQDPYNPPEGSVKETLSDTIWRLHNRGWEGQRQKGWTLLTSSLLSDLERTTGVHSEICGQGDNQILLTMFPIPEQYKNAKHWIELEPTVVRSMLDDYYMKLELKCQGVGLKVKTAETCRSLFYMNYGKRLFFCGAELSMTLKRLSKAMTESNDAFPLTETRLKTSQGASYAAGLYSHPSPWPFVLSRFCTILTMWESFSCNPLIGDHGMKRLELIGGASVKFFSILNKLPSCLGGPSQQSLAAFLCRGHPDPLCEELVMLCLNAKNGCLISKSIIKNALSGKWFNEPNNENRSSLIQAPYSLNLNIPTSAKSPISKAVLPALSAFCKNPSVEDLLSLEVDNYDEELIQLLSTLEPFNPLVANDVYGRSVVGQRQSFVNGLKNATSICRLIQDSSVNPIVEEIRKLERQQIDYWVDAAVSIYLEQNCDDMVIPLHHDLADDLRMISWGEKLTGVTVPHPLETFSMIKSDNDLCEDHVDCKHPEHLVFVRHSDKIFAPPGIDGKRCQLMRSRTGIPYLGNIISEGIINQQVICKNPTSSFNDACRLNVLRKWITTEDQPLNDLLKQIIQSRTDTPIELLDRITGRPSRQSYVHRAALKETKRSCAVTATSNMFTRIYTSSNRMGKFSTNDINFHLPYGPAYLSFSFLLCLEAVLNFHNDPWAEDPMQIYHCHIDIDKVPEVYDGRMVIHTEEDALLTEIEPPQLLFTRRKKLIFEDLSVDNKVLSFSNYLRAKITHCRVAYSNVLMGDLFIKEVVRKELLSSSMVDMYLGKEITISIGDMRLTNITELVYALAQNFCLVIGLSRATIFDKHGFIYSVIDFMSGFSKDFWDNFSNAMGKQDLIEKLYSMTEGSGHDYDGADQRSLDSAWKVAVASCMYDIICLMRSKMDLSDINPDDPEFQTIRKKRLESNQFLLVVPNLSAARHLYAKYVELCVWVYGKEGKKLSNSNLRHMGRVLSREVHQQETFKECVDTVTRMLSEVSLSALELQDCDELFKVKLYNVNDPWIDRLREAEFNVAENRERNSLLTINARLPNRDIIFNVAGDEQILDADYCKCHKLKRDPNWKVEGFFIRTGLLSSYDYLIADLITRYDLRRSSVLVVNDKLGVVSSIFAKDLLCRKIYCSPCRDITDYSPHTAGTYVPPKLLGCAGLDKITLPSSSALIGNILTSEKSQKLFLDHISRSDWYGFTLVIDETMTRSSLKKMENAVKTCLTLTSSIGSIKWIIIIGDFSCNHRLNLVMTQIASLFEMVVYSRSVFTQQSGSGAILGYRRRGFFTSFEDGKVLSLVRNHEILKREFVRENLFEMPYIAYLDPFVQAAWIQMYGDDVLNFGNACNSYLNGLGVGRYSVNREELISDLETLSRYHRDNMEEIHYSHNRTELQKRVSRSFILNLSYEGNIRTMEDQMCKRVKCMILHDILKSPPSSLIECVDRLKASVRKRYEMKIRDDKYYGLLTYDGFVRQFSFPLFCIIGHILGELTTGISKERLRSTHLRISDPAYSENRDFPVNLTIKEGERTYGNSENIHESRSKIMVLLMARRLLTKKLNVSSGLSHISEMMSKAGYLQVDMKEKDDGRNNVIWVTAVDAEQERFSRVLKNVDALIDEGEAVIIVADESLILNLVEKFHWDVLVRVPWTGSLPSTFLIQLVSKRKDDVSFSNYHIDSSITINVAFERDDECSCPCYDCAIEEELLKHFGITESVLSILYEKRVMETFHDVRTLV